jgi:hypothetical protein
MSNRALVLLAGVLAVATLNAATANPYPNEIKGLKFYERYLSPLQPGQSDTQQVVQVLGSDAGLDLKGWRITALYSCTDSVLACSHGLRNDRLAFVEVTPKRRMSLLHLKFPAAFVRSYGSVSEINVTCDVYTDKHGLQYWIVSGNFPAYKKGDLLKIDYGFADNTS